jgi:hypothetical protein
MSDKRGDAPKARLVDMEVQEVSLVDRAANKRKFLVVKRSEGMAQEGNADATGDAGEGAEGEHGGEGENADGDGSPLQVAASALEGLTGAMTRLQSAATDSQRAELGNVIQELREAADALEGIGTADGDDSDEDDADDEQVGSTGAPHVAGGELAALVGAMSELVSELRTSRVSQPASKASARRGASAPPGDDEDDADGDGADSGARRTPARAGAKRKAGSAASEGSSLEQDVRALRGELKAFTGALQEQARRLSKLEKRSAPPASRPPGERPSNTPRASATPRR